MKIKANLHWTKWEWEDEPRYELLPFVSNTPDRVFIGEYEFDVDIPADFDPVPQQIATFKAEKQRILAEAHVKVSNIEEQIQKLLCIEHKVEA